MQSSVSRILEANDNRSFLILEVHTAFAVHVEQEDIEITIGTTLDRDDIALLTVPENRTAFVRINQGLATTDSCLHQFFHVGVVSQVETNHVSTVCGLDHAQRIGTAKILLELNVVEIESIGSIAEAKVAVITALTIVHVESSTDEAAVVGLSRGNSTFECNSLPLGGHFKRIDESAVPCAGLSLCAGGNPCIALGLDVHREPPLVAFLQSFVKLDVELSVPCFGRIVVGNNLEAVAAVYAVGNNLRTVVGCAAVVRAILRNGEALEVSTLSVTIADKIQIARNRTYSSKYLQ